MLKNDMKKLDLEVSIVCNNESEVAVTKKTDLGWAREVFSHANGHK